MIQKAFIQKDNMEYQVAFRINFMATTKEGKNSYEATLTQMMPCPPFVGMHLGPSQLMTVCQVHWLGGNKFRADLVQPNTEIGRTGTYESLGEVVKILRAGCSDGKTLLFPSGWKFELVTWVDNKTVLTPINPI